MTSKAIKWLRPVIITELMELNLVPYGYLFFPFLSAYCVASMIPRTWDFSVQEIQWPKPPALKELTHLLCLVLTPDQEDS